MMRIASLAIAALVVTAACREDRPITPILLGPLPPGTVQAVVQRVAEHRSDSVVFRVHVASHDVQIGAYQGTLTFNPAALRILAVRQPTVSGEHRVVNADEAGEGVIRFAAFSTEAMRETQTFEFVAVPLQPVEAAALAATLSVVGEVVGVPVAASQIRANEGVRDAVTNRVIAQ